MTNVVQQVEGAVVAEAKTLWTDIETVWNKDVAPALAIGEQELVQLLKPLFGQVEAAALQDLVVFVKGIVAAAPTTHTLPEWETVIVNLAETFGGSLFGTIKGLGSNVFQALIGLVLAWVEQAAAAKVGTAEPAKQSAGT